MAVVVLHGCSEHAAAIQVHVPVPQRVSDGLPHRFKAGKMNHAIDGITAVEGALDSIGVTHIPFNNVDRIGSCKLLNPFQSLG